VEETLKELFPPPLPFLAFRCGCKTEAVVVTFHRQGLELCAIGLHVYRHERAAAIDRCDFPR